MLSLHDALPISDFGGMLADTGGEDERVQPAERGDQRTEFAADAVDEQVDGPGGMGIVAREQVAHVVTDARDAIEAAVAIEQVADGRSEEHTSELQSLMRTSYSVFCLKQK